MNLVDLVKGQLTKQVIGQIGGLLGEDEAKTQSAVNSAVPSLIAGLMKKGETNDGAKEIFGALDKNDDSILDDLGGILGGGGNNQRRQGVLDSGGGLLKMLLGGGVSNVINIISRVSGIGGKSSGSLLSLLLPIVMSVLGRQRKSSGFDIGGLSKILTGQKSHLAGLLPDGMDNALGLTSSSSSTGHTASASTAAPAARRDTHAPASAGGGGSLLAKILPLLILGALAFFGWKMFGGAAKNAVDGVADGVAGAGAAVGDAAGGVAGAVGDAAGGVAGAVGGAASGVAGAVGDAASGVNVQLPGADVGGQMTDLFGGFNKAFEGVTDEASARSAVPTFEGLSEKLGGLSQGVGVMPAAAREAVGQQVTGFIPTLQSAAQRVRAIPGVEGILGPIIDQIMEKLAVFTG